MTKPAIQHRPAEALPAPESALTRARKAVAAELHRSRVGRQGESLTPRRLADLTGHDLPTVRLALQKLREAGQAINTGTNSKPAWRTRLPEDNAPVLTGASAPSSELYQGEELRHYTNRPGATTAFTLPSVVNGVQVPARRARALLVGALTDRTNNARD